MIPIEFSRPIQVERLGHDERVYEIEADEAERAALVERYGILALDRLIARLAVKRASGGSLIRLQGRFSADVVQACVVSLEPVPARVEEDFSMAFAVGRAEESAAEIIVGLDDEDPPEAIDDGVIDLGEAVAEHLALALDPFPRAEGAVFADEGENDCRSSPAKANPFAALESLKKK